MPLFVYTGHDGPRGPELRPSVRPRHLAHLEALAASGRIRFAGPLIGEDKKPRGSVVLFEADDWATARTIAENDPYLLEGVFERVEVRATKQVLPEPD
jgi:hypothetical protein